MQYSLRRSRRARYLRVVVQADGDITVTAPERVSLSTVDSFVRRNDEWIRRALTRVRKNRVIYVSRGDIPRLKREASALVHELVERYARRYGFTYNRITIRAQRARWGSCSKSGNLSFNYKLAALPIEIAAYVVVHEVCHLGELNHSPAFWRLVEREIPHHRELRKRLRQSVFVFT